jgi:nickel-type superoxide dismutase maturation protease
MDTLVEVRLEGDSMWPTFHDGDVLLFDTAIDRATLAAGDVVLAVHPFKPNVRLVKRIQSVSDDTRFFLVGDQPDPTGSEDSHNFGRVDIHHLLARWTGVSKRA